MGMAISEIFTLIMDFMKQITLLSYEMFFYIFNHSLYIIIISLIILINLIFLLKLIAWFCPSGDPKKLNIAFFHPYCNAGGGGERVLWVSIKAIQLSFPDAECAIYTGDVDATPEQILNNMKQKFNIELVQPPKFYYLKLRKLVEAKYYPFFTLLGQSLGSFVLAGEAMGNFRPDIYIDTMGYAFTYPLFRFIAGSNVACYTHYPTISSDMLSVVAKGVAAHNNRALFANNFFLRNFKLLYYNLFAFVYGLVGRCASVVMVNSSWTREHVELIWKCSDRIHTVFPPCNTEHFSSLAPVPDEEKKFKSIVSIGQFRPEKNYPLQLRAFKKLLDVSGQPGGIKLVLIGGVRDAADEERVRELKALASSLGIEEGLIDWRVNASFEDLLEEVRQGTVGLHSMWNEHFGIGVVECMAGGLVMVANDSGGPKMDIVQPFEGETTGFLADDETSYAKQIKLILEMTSDEKTKIRLAARNSVSRFSDEKFGHSFLSALTSLLESKKNV